MHRTRNEFLDKHGHRTYLVYRLVDQFGNTYTPMTVRYLPASRTQEETVASFRHHRCLWLFCGCYHHTCTGLPQILWKLNKPHFKAFLEIIKRKLTYVLSWKYHCDIQTHIFSYTIATPSSYTCILYIDTYPHTYISMYKHMHTYVLYNLDCVWAQGCEFQSNRDRLSSTIVWLYFEQGLSGTRF